MNNNFAINEVSKMGISQLVSLTEKLGFACLTKNNLPAAMIFSLSPDKGAVSSTVESLRRLHETKRLSMEHDVLATTEFYREYIRDFGLLVFMTMNEIDFNNGMLRELSDGLFQLLESLQDWYVNGESA